MNRKQALKIKLESWMLEPEFLNLIPIYEIEATETAAVRGETPVIWMKEHDEFIFRIADGRPMDILANLRLWFDDGEREIRINESNYKDYDSELFYSVRKGIYDDVSKLD